MFKNSNQEQKKFLKIISKIDKLAFKRYKKIQSTFLGAATLKLISEITLALLIAIAVYLSQFLYSEYERSREVKIAVNNLSIGISEDYVRQLFGVPKVNFIENSNGYENFYYDLDKLIVRVVSDNDIVIAYFITIASDDWSIDLRNHHPVQDFILGKDTFKNNIGKPVIIDAKYSLNAYVENYYYEEYNYGWTGQYNFYRYGNISYGTVNNTILSLLQTANSIKFNTGTIDYDNMQSLRDNVIPNTFGVIFDGYEEEIHMIPDNVMWMSVYRAMVFK